MIIIFKVLDIGRGGDGGWGDKEKKLVVRASCPLDTSERDARTTLYSQLPVTS